MLTIGCYSPFTPFLLDAGIASYVNLEGTVAIVAVACMFGLRDLPLAAETRGQTLPT
jgi:hypothetical protein